MRVGLRRSVRHNKVELEMRLGTYAALKLIKVEHLREVLHALVQDHILVQEARLHRSGR